MQVKTAYKQVKTAYKKSRASTNIRNIQHKTSKQMERNPSKSHYDKGKAERNETNRKQLNIKYKINCW